MPGAADADAEIEEGPDFGGLLKAKTENCCPDSSVARSSRLVSEFPKRVPKFFRPESIAENWVPACSHLSLCRNGGILLSVSEVPTVRLAA